MDLSLLFGTTENLQYFADTVAWANATSSIAAVGVGAGFTAGEKIIVTNADESANNGIKTISVVGVNLLTLEDAVTEDASDAIVINQIIVGDWMRVDFYSRLVGSLYSSQNSTFYVDWSHDGSTVDFTQATNVTSTAAAYAQEVVGKWARFRLYNAGADQTALAVYVYGKSEY